MDENGISPIIYDATVVEREIGKRRYKLEIDGIGEGWITRKYRPNKNLEEGTKLAVEIIQQLSTGRWLVNKIHSIDGEIYTEQKAAAGAAAKKAKEEEEAKKKISNEFSGLDRRYVKLGKNRIKILRNYGLSLTDEAFLTQWENEAFVDIHSYSESHEIIPNHPESKFSGKVIKFLNFVGWQGFIWCKEINSLVYVRHDVGRKEGSIVPGAKIEFYLGTSFDNRNELQFYATDWNSTANRGNAPEPALTFNFEDINDSKEIINEILTDKTQFVLITSLIQKETKRYSSDEVIKSLANKFPNHPTMVLPWPQFRLDESNPNNSARSSAGRFSHPLIKNYLSSAVVLFPKEDGGEEE